MKKLMKTVFIGIGILILLGILANACGSKDTGNPSGTGNTSPATTKTDAKTPLSNEGVSSDVKIVVNGMETKEQLGDNQYSKVKANGIFKVVKVTLTNNQKDAITIDSNSFKLVDNKGREFTYSIEGQTALETSLGETGSTFFFKQLNPGLSITGQIAFDVPKDAAGFVLKAQGGMIGKTITLKVE